MALRVGFSSACRQAREGGDVEVSVETEEGTRVFTLPWFVVCQVDALLELWRREAHETLLLARNHGNLRRTLFEALSAGGVRDTAFLLARRRPSEWGDLGRTALWWSACCGHLRVVEAFLDAGFEGEPRDNALYIASKAGHARVAELLLDRGADVHFRNDAALRYAARYGRVDCVRSLVGRGAGVSALSGRSLRLVRENGGPAMLALLLELGVS